MIQNMKSSVLIIDSKTPGTAPAEGIARIIIWSRHERMQRAIKTGAIFFGLAIGAAFIPLLHFVLVPAFLLATPIAAYLAYGQESVISGGNARCPDCGNEFELARTKPAFPLNDLCTHCRREVRIRLHEE